MVLRTGDEALNKIRKALPYLALAFRIRNAALCIVSRRELGFVFHSYRTHRAKHKYMHNYEPTHSLFSFKTKRCVPLILTAPRRLFLQTHTTLVRHRRRSFDVTVARGRARFPAI